MTKINFANILGCAGNASVIYTNIMTGYMLDGPPTALNHSDFNILRYKPLFAMEFKLIL